MTALHILTSEYPPDLGGVSDYTRQVAEALARDGQEVHVWCPPTNEPRETSGVRVHAEAGRFRRSDLRRLTAALDSCPSPRRLLVQWVPHGFGYRSMNLPFCLWLAGRAAKEDSVELMVHEPFIELRWGPLRHIAIAIVHRVMTMVLMAAAEKVWVAIPAWESRLRPYAFGRSLPVNWRRRPRRRATRRNRSGVCGSLNTLALTGDASFRDLRRRSAGASWSRPRHAVGRRVRIRRACLEWGLQPQRQLLQERVLYYLGANRSGASFTSRSGSQLLLIGGPPFPEKILNAAGLRGAHASGDCRRTNRLGGAAAVRRCGRVFGAAPRCAEPRQVCESEPCQLT